MQIYPIANFVAEPVYDMKSTQHKKYWPVFTRVVGVWCFFQKLVSERLFGCICGSLLDAEDISTPTRFAFNQNALPVDSATLAYVPSEPPYRLPSLLLSLLLRSFVPQGESMPVLLRGRHSNFGQAFRSLWLVELPSKLSAEP